MSAAVANTVANYAAKRFLRDGMDKYKTKAPCGDNVSPAPAPNAQQH